MNTIPHPESPQQILAAKRQAKKEQREKETAARLESLHKLEQLDRIASLTPRMNDFDLDEMTLVADLLATLAKRHTR